MVYGYDAGVDASNKKMSRDIDAQLFITSVLSQERDDEHLRATHDKLTGLKNQSSFEEYAEMIAEYKGSAAILVLDLDNFKSVNDRLGHARGNETLQDTAAILEKCLRPSDIAFRVGGDEFVVLIDTNRRADNQEGLSAEQIIQHAANRINSVTSEYVQENEDLIELGFGISVGGAVIDEHLNIQEAFKAADQEMYRNKSYGAEKMMAGEQLKLFSTS